jgi:hypothetical protein
MKRVRHREPRLPRRLALVTAVVAVALPATALASAQFVQTAKVELTSSTANQSTGISAELHSEDPGNPGGKPKALAKLTLKLPAGTRVDKKGVVECNLPNAQVLAGRCPDASELGTGTAKANGFPLIPTTTEDIKTYATKGGVMFALTDNVQDPAPAQTLVLRAKISSRGVLTATVPALPLPIPGQFAVLTDFNVDVKKASRKVKGKTRVFIRTPKKCKKKGWTTTTSFRYSDGTKETKKTKQSCHK